MSSVGSTRERPENLPLVATVGGPARGLSFDLLLSGRSLFAADLVNKGLGKFGGKFGGGAVAATLLAALSRASPEVAPFPFTTLMPNLGAMSSDGAEGGGGGRQPVLADLPGLVEGAHQGRGLGRLFLRHLRRVQVMLYVIDTSSAEPTLGSISAGGALAEDRMASISRIPSGVRGGLIRTMASTDPSSSAPANQLSVAARASCLCCEATASSRSTHMMSAPVPIALGNISGLLPGAKMKLRRGRIGVLAIDGSPRLVGHVARRVMKAYPVGFCIPAFLQFATTMPRRGKASGHPTPCAL